MNICILTRSTIFHENYGGMEHVAHDLAKELSVLGNNVTMITTSMGENQLKVVELENLGYNFVSLPNMKPMAYSKSWWINVKKYFVELNATYKVDLILSISSAANSLIGIPETKDIPILFQAHGTAIGEVKTKLKLNLKKKLSSIKNIYSWFKDIYYIPRYDAVITIGEKVYKEYLNSIIKLNKTVYLINNAVDTNVFSYNKDSREEIRKDLNIDIDDYVFLSTSRLNAQKGIKESINIFHEIQKDLPNSSFLIIGDGPEKDNLVEEIKKLKLSNKVKILGEIPREELDKFYSASDFMLFSTLRQEGLPLTILEALSSGLVCFVSENIKFDSDFPIIAIDPHDYKKSAERVNKEISNSNIKNIKEKGVSIIEERYSMKEWGKQYQSLFKEKLVK